MRKADIVNIIRDSFRMILRDGNYNINENIKLLTKTNDRIDYYC